MNGELHDEVGRLCREGREEEACLLLRRKEVEDDSEAIEILGEFFLAGILFEKNVAEGMKYLYRAFRMGDLNAAWMLGVACCSGEDGIPMDWGRALFYFETGAQNGHIKCAGGASDCYFYGRGTIENNEKGLYYARMAADGGDFKGMTNLAMCYDDGIVVEADPDMAIYWYKRAMEQKPNDNFLMIRIAICLADPYEHYTWVPRTQERLQEAYYYAKQAAENGDHDGNLLMGWFYEMGYVVGQDYDLAYRYFELSANQGNEIAREHLQMYRRSIRGTYFIP